MADPQEIIARYPGYRADIGIEVHVQLATRSKIFCSCAQEFNRRANMNICDVCTGQPGSLPVLNKRVLEYALRAGIALLCTINKHCSFARKHYFYPDLPKNYQITQSDEPICRGGSVRLTLEDGSTKDVRLVRIHMEEDAGKSIHAGSVGESLVDFNRAGVPLLEIVSYPDIATSREAREYLKNLKTIVEYLGICTGNMQEGAFRADTNVSVRTQGSSELGTRVELKNINSFKYIADAVDYEIARQIVALESGERVCQETRLWDSKDKKTYVMRTKEEAADYRYFRDPDLAEIHVSDAWIEALQKQLPELPHQKLERLCRQHGLSVYEASILVQDRALADYFEKARTQSASTQIIKWILRDLLGYLKEHNLSLSACNVTPEKLVAIVGMLEKGVINAAAAKEVFVVVAQTGNSPFDVVKTKGLEQIGSHDDVEKIVKEVIAENPSEVQAYKAGKEKLFGYLVGQAMRKTQGKGDPKLINELLKKNLMI